MIYKFIDDNNTEITVNSLSSLQALVDSETINEKTKVKAGLRGKWTTANKIDGIVFAKEEEDDDSNTSEEDIKTFITTEKTKEDNFKDENESLKVEPKTEKR